MKFDPFISMGKFSFSPVNLKVEFIIFFKNQIRLKIKEVKNKGCRCI